jgi:hypothetical protein
MNAVISSVLSEVRSGYTSPPFDELEKLIEGFIKAIGELLDTEDEELVVEMTSLLRKIIEAKNDFLYAKIMKEKPEGGTPFTRAIEKEKEEKERPAPAQVKRGTAPTLREDKD